MARVVQFTAPRQAAVVEFRPEVLPPGHVRVRTAYSGISAGTELTAYRGTNPYLTRTWDLDARIFRDSEAGVAFPVVGWGYSETGSVVEVGEGVSGLAVGDEVWGIWGHRSEAVVPAEKLIGHQLPAGVSLSSAAFGRVGAIAFNAVLAARINLGEGVVMPTVCVDMLHFLGALDAIGYDRYLAVECRLSGDPAEAVRSIPAVVRRYV